MPSDAKLEVCPYCGSECPLMHTQVRVRARCFNSECAYQGPGFNAGQDAQAAAAHNTLCRKLAMHGELVALLESARDCLRYGGEEIEGYLALLARAAQLENGGESDE